MVGKGLLSLPDLIAKLTVNPAGILGLPCGLKPGSPADVTVIDPEAEWVVSAADFRSLSRNTPFEGRSVKGRAVHVWVDGRLVHSLASD
jgi:dihydroorotase